MDKDGVEVINVGHKNVLHGPEGADREGTRKIGVHGTGGQVGEGCEAEDIVCTTDFFDWGQRIDLAACIKNGRLEGLRRAGALAVVAHVAFVGGGRKREMCVDKACQEPRYCHQFFAALECLQQSCCGGRAEGLVDKPCIFGGG